jgi:glucose-6-phosphate dehydrogenase assembly protein OpcA
MSSEIQPKAAAKNAPQGIDVGRLEKELAANWRSAGDGQESSVTRVCVLNLIVYVAPGEDRAKLEELLDAVTEQSPGRMLVLVADRDAAEAKLEAYVSTRCQVAPRGAAKQVCGEQVTIEAGGASLAAAASAIEPLVVPDVPVFLWWKNIPHEEDKLFDRLVELSDRVVIDSLVFDRPHEDMKRLAEIVGARRQYMLASDLNWGRLTSWRNLIASFWDVPDYRPHLDSIDDVLVEYDPPDAASEQIAAHALLLVGWLAAELKWEPTGEFAREEKGGARWVLRADGRRINVSFRPTADRHGCDGLIATLTLRADASGAEFYVGVNEGWTKLETSAKIGDAREVGRVVSYEAKSEGRRLARELSILSRDEVYERAVAAVGRLIEVLQKS